MRKIALNIFIALFILCFASLKSFAEENINDTEFNIFTGIFDFSDEGQKSG